MAPRIVTYSELSTFRNCRQKWQYAYQEQLTPLRVAPALTLGSAVHEALALFHASNVNEDRAIRMTRAIVESDKYLNKSLDFMAASGVEIWDEDRAAVDVAKAQAGHMIANYVEHDRDAIIQFEGLKTEIELTVPLRTPAGGKARGVMLRSKIDGIGWDQHGMPILVEHKTAASADSKYLSRVDLDDQLNTYLWVVSQAHGKVDAIYNVIGKKVPKPPKVLKSGKLSTDIRQNTIYDLFMQAINEVHGEGEAGGTYRGYLDLLAARPDVSFARERVLRSSHELERIGQELYWTTREMLNKHVRIFRNSKACETYGCAYRTICIEDTPDARESLYRVRDARHQELEPEEVTE